MALRTPDESFRDLPGYSFEPRYVEMDGLRVHYLDEGPRTAPPVVLLHGEPTWSYLWRGVIPRLAAAGHRVLAPDLVGFGRSDKPERLEDYSYARHVAWLTLWFETVGLTGVSLVCHDWGGLLGLRVVGERPELFARVVATNTGLPTGDRPMSDAFLAWRKFSREAPEFRIARIVSSACNTPLSPAVAAAYDAPFPDDRFKAGARAFPSLVPITPDDPASAANRLAWESLDRFERPFLTAFSDNDPFTGGGERPFQKRVPGARGQAHATIVGAGHFLQEDRSEELARVVGEFLAVRV